MSKRNTKGRGNARTIRAGPPAEGLGGGGGDGASRASTSQGTLPPPWGLEMPTDGPGGGGGIQIGRGYIMGAVTYNNHESSHTLDKAPTTFMPYLGASTLD